MELTVLILALVSTLTTATTALVWGGPRFVATMACLISARKDPAVYKRDLQTLRSITRKEPPAK